jgi:transcriptional regulator with XRE-family HTH domain
MRLGLKGALLQRGLSQRELCRLANIAENRFSTILNGWAAPTPSERTSIASVLKQDENLLFDAGSTIEIRSGR